MLLVWKPTKVQIVCIRELDRQALIAMVLLECTGVRDVYHWWSVEGLQGGREGPSWAGQSSWGKAEGTSLYTRNQKPTHVSETITQKWPNNETDNPTILDV